MGGEEEIKLIKLIFPSLDWEAQVTGDKEWEGFHAAPLQ